MEINVWVDRVEKGHIQIKDRIVESLAQTGIHANQGHVDAPTVNGLIFFSEVTPQLCKFLSEISQSGRHRILAVSLSPAVFGADAVWHLLRAGACDVITLMPSVDTAAAITARITRWDDVDRIVASALVRNNIVGQSPALIKALRSIVAGGRFTDDTILLLGESGTGKELAARLIHTLDPVRKDRDLVILDCTAITPELSGSEFFGHERGAFTGAVSARDGAFALADGGTLFVDEIGELPIRLQAQLLRAIQERIYKRVGSSSWQHTNFRLICATNRDLQQEVAQGRFRADLYYRIAGWICRLPPLRERTADILPLARHFLREQGPGEAVTDLDEPVRGYLLTRDYPGNVRDLRQLMARIGHRHVGPGPISVGDIPDEEWPSTDPAGGDLHVVRFEQVIRHALALGEGLKEISRAATETAIRIALEDEEGNLQRAARRLGVTDRALQMRRANRRKAV
jgi:transcriptional regulator with GAF, ATPase, and Fis domain